MRHTVTAINGAMNLADSASTNSGLSDWQSIATCDIFTRTPWVKDRIQPVQHIPLQPEHSCHE
jgi:hypothetical protein